MKRLPLAVTTLLSLVACAPTSVDAPPVDESTEVASLTAAAEAYHEAASTKNAPDVVAKYDDTAVMVPPNAELVQGIAEVQEYRFGFISTPGVELEFELVRVEVSESGDMGWTLAVGEITINREGEEPGRDVVRDFHVWHKQPDGSWGVVVDVWNSGMPAG
jgi:ketosteroid isomerase-like protein